MAVFHNMPGENRHYSGEVPVDPILSDQSVVVGDYTPSLPPKEAHSYVCNFECACSATQPEVTALPSNFVNANDDNPNHLLALPVELAQKSLGSTGEEMRTSSTSLASGSGLVAFLVDTIAQKYSQMRLFSSGW